MTKSKNDHPSGWEYTLTRPVTRWQDAQERWRAQLRMWDIEDQGGYRAAVERELDGEPAKHAIWTLDRDKASNV